jgi:hypothetical protein
MIYRLCFCLFLSSLLSCSGVLSNKDSKKVDSTQSERSQVDSTKSLPIKHTIEEVDSTVSDTAFSNHAVETIGNFPECKLAEEYLDSVTKGSRNLQFTIFGNPTKDAPYYEIDVGNTIPDGGDAGHYETYMHFHVYNNNGHALIKFYDIPLDTELTLKEWRKKEEAPKKEGKKYYFFYIDE